MTLLQFILAILLLLCTPGPTNTLMALGGYSRGWARALPLIGGELGGYLTVIVPVATLRRPLLRCLSAGFALGKARRRCLGALSELAPLDLREAG